MNIVRRLNIAFIRYPNRLNAEFTKIAMSDQVCHAWLTSHVLYITHRRLQMLGGREQVNIRWAFEDPNPKAKEKV